MKEKVKAIMDQGITCFCNRQLIYNHAEEMFADAGIMAIEHVDFDGIERLALVTGKAPGLLACACRHGAVLRQAGSHTDAFVYVCHPACPPRLRQERPGAA